MHTITLAELVKGLAAGKFSSQELTQHYLRRLNTYQPSLNCMITLCEQQALAQAHKADQLRAQQKAQPLTGIPLVHKDIFCTQGIKTSCGSKMLDNFIAPYNATVVTRLQDAGMVTLGKANMDEFAMGSSNENSYYGPVHNPWGVNHVPGGSSGGSAASVAARLTPVATGTDTGGSIRQPAAFCGITGIKPTYGRVSRYGMIAFASSLDQAGLFTQTAEDAALVLSSMAGFDENDSTSSNLPVPDYTATLNNSLKGLRIGLPKEYFSEQLDTTIADTLHKAIQVLEQEGASIHEISLKNCHLAVPVYYVIAPAECSSNLARFDGIRYGYRCDAPKNLRELYERSRSEGFGMEVKRRIMIGTYVLSAGYYDAYYLKAQQLRQLIRTDYVQAFEQVDVILGPTTPTTAFALGAKATDPVSMYLNDIYTIATNLAGLPGISIPAGFIGGLPIGMQLTGKYFSEAQLLNVAHRYQQHTDWHQRCPNL